MSRVGLLSAGLLSSMLVGLVIQAQSSYAADVSSKCIDVEGKEFVADFLRVTRVDTTSWKVTGENVDGQKISVCTYFANTAITKRAQMGDCIKLATVALVSRNGLKISGTNRNDGLGGGGNCELIKNGNQ